MRVTAGLVFIASAVASVMALKEPPTELQVGKLLFFFHRQRIKNKN